MGPEHMYGSNNHLFPGHNTQDWSLTQIPNGGSSMNPNTMIYPAQNPPLTSSEPGGQPDGLDTSLLSAQTATMHNKGYGLYAQGGPGPINYSGNHGSTFRQDLPAQRPQVTPTSSNPPFIFQGTFSPNGLQAQVSPQIQQPYGWPNQTVHPPVPSPNVLPSPNGGGQNAQGNMHYQGNTYNNYPPPVAPPGQTLPAVPPLAQLVSQEAPRRIKRAREESDSDEPPPKKKKKGGKRPRIKEPPPAYNRRYPRPPSWGKADDGSSPLFVYNDDGELRTDRKYTSKEIKQYIENNPRPLKIWVQQSPTQVAHRLGNRNTCMWMGCVKQGHKIDTGFIRVAFDEFAKQSKKGHRDPLRPAAVMHMWCYEQCFDPLVDYHAFRLKADKRPLAKETRNMIGIANKGKHIVRNAFKPWLIKTQFTDRARKYTDSLSSALNEYHLSTRSNRKLEIAHQRSKKTGECIINFHKGDLMLFCQDTGKNKQNMKQKDLPANRFQFRPLPVRLRRISVDEDSDSSDSEAETYAAQSRAIAQPEEPLNALKPLGETGVNSRTPAVGVDARPERSHSEADGAENEGPKASMGDDVQDNKRRKNTCENVPLDNFKPPVFETPAEPELVYTAPGSCPEAYGATNEEPKGSVRDVVQDGKIGEFTCENALSDELTLQEWEIPTGSESYPGAGSSSDAESPLTKLIRETINLTEQDDLFGDKQDDLLAFEPWPAPEEQPEPKVPELKLPQPKAPEPNEQLKLKLPVPIEEPKESAGVEDLSGSGGSQAAEAGPR
ncbi:unnamed protein product [Clonostachys byssicola]|uniref:Uncharacterized protein n=1 Tax=Clonostachys byssicola TaxID=160290 RepID=A0A9N9YA65_9HYPO|nr:unnamed protein product [Clonostachys byssicola]